MAELWKPTINQTPLPFLFFQHGDDLMSRDDIIHTMKDLPAGWHLFHLVDEDPSHPIKAHLANGDSVLVWDGQQVKSARSWVRILASCQVSKCLYAKGVCFYDNWKKVVMVLGKFGYLQLCWHTFPQILKCPKIFTFFNHLHQLLPLLNINFSYTSTSIFSKSTWSLLDWRWYWYSDRTGNWTDTFECELAQQQQSQQRLQFLNESLGAVRNTRQERGTGTWNINPVTSGH